MVGVLDTDSGFVQVLVKRLDAAGIQRRVIASPPSYETLVSLRLSALVVDPAVLHAAAPTTGSASPAIRRRSSPG